MDSASEERDDHNSARQNSENHSAGGTISRVFKVLLPLLILLTAITRYLGQCVFHAKAVSEWIGRLTDRVNHSATILRKMFQSLHWIASKSQRILMPMGSACWRLKTSHSRPDAILDAMLRNAGALCHWANSSLMQGTHWLMGVSTTSLEMLDVCHNMVLTALQSLSRGIEAITSILEGLDEVSKMMLCASVILAVTCIFVSRGMMR